MAVGEDGGGPAFSGDGLGAGDGEKALGETGAMRSSPVPERQRSLPLAERRLPEPKLS